MTDATPTIEEMPEMRPSAEERLARKYESGRHAYPSYAKLARERAGDFTLCSIEAIAEAYRDGYTAALSSLSPLIEAMGRVLYGQPGYDARRAWEEAKTALSTFPAPASPSRWRHKKRGTSYEVIGTGRLQCAVPCLDTQNLVIYRGEDGALWARPTDEFYDGRFERVAPPTTSDGSK